MPTNLSSTDITLLVICIILFVIIATCAGIIIYLRLRKNKKHKMNNEIDDYRLEPLNKEINRYKKLQEQYKRKLIDQEYADYDIALRDMKAILDVELEQYKKNRIQEISQDIERNKNEILKTLLLSTMQPMHLKIINEASVHYLPIDEKHKPLLIGKKGSNIKKLNEITNCNINIDRSSEYIEISCPNPYDKQLAINTINHLIKSEAFDSRAIENVYKKESRLMVKDCIETGKKYLENLNIKVQDDGVFEYVGRLKYRWSFNQNVLQHSYEVALICEKLADELGLNPQTAKEVGFFHDIGKSRDYERRYDHIDTGVKIAKKYDLSQEIINGILKHHRNNCNDDYVLLVRCADAWSAARKGARHVPTTNEQNIIKIIENKIRKIRGIISYKVTLNNNDINIVFVPVIPDRKTYLTIKYEIIKTMKRDVRLNKFRILIHD